MLYGIFQKQYLWEYPMSVGMWLPLLALMMLALVPAYGQIDDDSFGMLSFTTNSKVYSPAHHL